MDIEKDNNKVEKMKTKMKGRQFVAGMMVGGELLQIIDYEVTDVEFEYLENEQKRMVARLRDLADPRKIMSVSMKALRRGKSNLLLIERARRPHRLGLVT